MSFIRKSLIPDLRICSRSSGRKLFVKCTSKEKIKDTKNRKKSAYKVATISTDFKSVKYFADKHVGEFVNQAER